MAEELVVMQRGDRVRLISDPERQGIVLEVLEGRDGLTLLVFFGPGEEVYVNAQDVEPILSVTETLIRSPIDNEELAFRYLLIRATERLNDILYSLYASRTDFLPYQFKPVLKFLHSEHRRLYIADEVGLGKTIEAALILLEHLARVDTQAILVVCPANITSKWQRELNRRFALGFKVYRTREFLEFLEGDQRIPSSGLRAVCSLQTLRTDAMREALERSPLQFDFIIFDEAHNIKNEETASWHLAELLSQRCMAMLMLSATPLMLGSPDLFNQLRVLLPSIFTDFTLFREMLEPNIYLNEARHRLGNPLEALEVLSKVEATAMRERFIENETYRRIIARLSTGEPFTSTERVRMIEDLLQLSPIAPIFVRTRKREVQFHFPTRRAVVLHVQLTSLERRCYEVVREALRLRSIARGGPLGGLGAIMPLRLAASCLPAMVEYFGLEGMVVGREGATIPADIEELDPLDDEFEGEWEQALVRGLAALEAEVRALLQQLGDWDSKFDELLGLLNTLKDQEDRPKVVLFSFFKKTLRYLERRLGKIGWGEHLLYIDGDTPAWEQDERIIRFHRDPNIRLLLSTEVGGEGVDLQVAYVLINYDLPWNPMRVEQRIGRLDRYGQRSPVVHIYNFSIPGTIDAVILDRLYWRIRIFEEYIGDLDAILGDIVPTLSRILFDPRLTDDELAQKLEQIAENIERQKHHMEELEESAKELMGFDELFQEELEALKRQGRYFTPEQLAFLTRALLERVLGKGGLLSKDDRRGAIWRLRSSPGLISLIRTEFPYDESAQEFTARCERSTIRLTFDPEKAQANPELELVAHQHPLLHGLLRRFLRADRQREIPVSIVEVPGAGLREEYALFGYILEWSGLVKHRELRRLLVRREDLAIEDDWERTEQLFGKLILSRPGWRRSPEELAWFREAEQKARDHMMAIRSQEEQLFQQEEAERRRIRQLTIRRETEIRVQRAEAIRDQILARPSPDERILRLWEGRIRRLREEEQRRLREIEQLPRPQVRFKLAIAGVAVCR